MTEPIMRTESCAFCGSKEEMIICIVCGEREIKHMKNSYACAHTCERCNIELGKGE